MLLYHCLEHFGGASSRAWSGVELGRTSFVGANSRIVLRGMHVFHGGNTALSREVQKFSIFPLCWRVKSVTTPLCWWPSMHGNRPMAYSAEECDVGSRPAAEMSRHDESPRDRKALFVKPWSEWLLCCGAAMPCMTGIPGMKKNQCSPLSTAKACLFPRDPHDSECRGPAAGSLQRCSQGMARQGA